MPHLWANNKIGESMLIGVLPDMHVMERTPKKRKDRMRETSIAKLCWCLERFTEKMCHFVGVPGDLFDSSTASYDFTGEVIRVFRLYNIKILAVPGQHDLRYHTRGINNTPLGLLLAADVIWVPTIDNPISIGGVRVFGCGWGDDAKLQDLIASEEDVSSDILIVHRTIVKDKELFKGQTNFSPSKSFLKRNPFRIILSGDNHQRFITKNNNQVLINGGSIIRLEKGQIDYQPRIHMVDTDTLKIIHEDVPIEPDVFDEQQLVEDEEKENRKARMENLINTIRADTTEVNFPAILHSITEQSNPNTRQRELLDDIIEEAKGMVQ